MNYLPADQYLFILIISLTRQFNKSSKSEIKYNFFIPNQISKVINHIIIS